ncbi:AAA family ATPase [Aetokthonos hydrillicola Thurmond2011]|jgi:predicted ATPase/signal transduction histidine kinase/tRNA A-37 threonylcarbamoyl transferase component Bud32|uniref:histidine kinase n=1 Tax=Aetokthonos hydrillicola Thurmond2011 TaxID=2712845 RepID=A0AAP5IEZ7_9CYAN|nr:ATP-binding sensor histidine kinase [Aetokthonos hydrillicola]MBO3461718.1 AAA family ATPase [Aetokthonos hydrillicola CCALA 1050]MBW4583902.1 AAA family ATPase [Aetokthonos hydrillicola CCALA 1050]MDR9898902.1 AAA family ATPase [Aetokthonos hydrillicola Thurmond2011]
MITIPGIEVTTNIYESASTLVYRGIRIQDNKPVILKVLKKEYPTSAELARYKQEFEIIRSLNTSAVVSAYSLVKYHRTLVILLEDFGGESLKKLINTRKLTLAEFLLIAVQTADNLARIHAAQIIHKDINPSNIVFNQESKQVKFIDFGIATVVSHENPTIENHNVLEGTPAYMSPELTGRMNCSVDYRTDFYSLGATFYELLTHHLPFETTDLLELVHCHIAKQPIPPHEINPDVPLVISNIVTKLLAKNADDRYQSAWGIKADLEESLLQLEATGKISNLTIACQDISSKFQILQKLYGREREIETLLKAFERVSHGSISAASRSEMMLISGHTGVGKSALVREVYKYLSQQPGYFISGKVDELHRNIPYSALIQAFQELIKQLLTESETQISQWKEKLLEVLGSNGQVIIDVIPEVELIIDKQAPSPISQTTEFQNCFNLIFQEFVRVFTQGSHPLVIFLDDLQWIDDYSLKLIELLLTTEESQYLFFIGAYRNNELSRENLLLPTLERIKNNGGIVNFIHLFPLKLNHVNQLVADALNCSLEKAKLLSELIHYKTNGNSFFVNEFLQSLYQEKLLCFNFSALNSNDRWQWNLDQIRARNFTDNVVELMISKIQKLSCDTQNILQHAACIGYRFDVQALATVSEKSLSLVVNCLSEAVAEGLIMPLSDVYNSIQLDKLQPGEEIKAEYKFTHDRIQQATYSLISIKYRIYLHRKIGQFLLKTTPKNQQEQNIFDIVNQLNLGVELINSQPERDELALLNLKAAQKAKGTAAYQPALEYLKIGRNLLEETCWERQYNLMLALYVEAVEVAYLNTNFEEMDKLAEVVLCKAKTLLDKVKVYQVKIQSYMAQNKPLQALMNLLPVMKSLGIKFHQNSTHFDISLSLLMTKISLARYRIEDLINLPAMTNPYKLAAIDTLSRLRVAAYLTVPKLYSLIVFEEIRLSVKYGHALDSVCVYGAYGMILCGVVGDVNSGYQFGELALKVLEKFNIKKQKHRTMHLVYGFLKHWKEHANITLNPLAETYKTGRENGDLEFAGYSAFLHCLNAYCVGKDLRDIEQQICLYIHDINRLKQKTVFNYLKILQQTVLQLMDKSKCEDVGRLMGESYNEERMLPIHFEVHDIPAIANVYLHKLILCYLFQNFSQALENATTVKKYLAGVTPSLLIPLFYLYDSLTRLAVFPNVSHVEQKQLLKQVKNNQKKMRKWAYYAPMNYLHKYYLVEAERERLLGKAMKAREYYDQAIALAHENEYLNEEALANELAARFYLERNQNHIARHYLQDAHYIYQLWGCSAKVKHLETQYPEFLSKADNGNVDSISLTSSSSENASITLDFNSVVKCSQAISGEIVLDNLLQKLMNIVIENAGAQKGYLILDAQKQPGEQEDHWVIKAEGTVDCDATTTLQPIAIDAVDPKSQIPLLSAAIVNYVAHTRENVVLDDATNKGQFTRDRYIIATQPKSILCTPLIHKGKLNGILYLENNLTTKAFTRDRVEVLKILSAQAAISIENSRLYEQLEGYSRTLEQKVEARTQELQHKNNDLANLLQKLKATQAQIIAQEKLASLGGLTAGIAHEIKNPLNFVNNFAELSVELSQELLEEIESQKDRLDPESVESIEEIVGHISQNAQKINEHGKRADNIVRGMLMHSRGQTGERRLTNINTLLAESINLASHGMHAKIPSFNITIKTDFDPHIREINIIADSLNRAFINLINNACYAAHQKRMRLQRETLNEGNRFLPTLFVNTKDLGDRVEIRIRDNGEGIPQKVLNQIFEPFFTTKPVGEGTGLGLSICHDIIVQAHQGEIKVNTEIGKYTEFVITLPYV